MWYFYNKCDRIVLILAGFLFLSAVGFVCWDRYRIRCMVMRMNQMLEAAIAGTFSETLFDESVLSSLESRLAGYLSAAFVSSRNLAKEKEKIKELVADISHQTKTPIANILLYAQLLEEQELSEENRQCVKALFGQAEKLKFLIASLVKLSRLETGVFVLYPIRQRLDSILEEISVQFALQAEGKGVQFWVEETEEEAVFDKKWTMEALGNLVDNAIKYTAAGGEVRVSVERYELFCRVIVSDSGIGIREEEYAKVFGRFYRSASVCETEGVGIGLYLTRQILLEEGGYLKIASKEGVGTQISMFLPR
ncbi:MAG: HAMP domain-containing sensor histidine kinase [Lachnospiraceae bacterium]|nr:HAMP domain-containing sensor histidine kinase [Lachnospiraceae bacterium]